MRDENEIWKRLPEPYDKYEISNFGNCRNIKTQKILAKQIVDGYVKYNLYTKNLKNKLKSSQLGHRLVAMMFVSGRTDKKCIVNHKNGIKNDNVPANLEWVSFLDNNIHKINILYKGKNSYNNGNSLKIEQYDFNNNLIRTFLSLGDAERFLNRDGATGFISACCKGKRDHAYGYIWKYMDDPDLPGEKWIDIIINDRQTKISNLGRVITFYNIKTYGWKSSSGYMRVMINSIIFKVHRFVAEVWCEKPPNQLDLVVDHIDGNRINNKAENLRWVSKKQNSIFATGKKIKSINIKNDNIMYFNSLSEATENLDALQPNISKVLKGERKSAGGYRFEFVKEENESAIEYPIDQISEMLQ